MRAPRRAPRPATVLLALALGLPTVGLPSPTAADTGAVAGKATSEDPGPEGTPVTSIPEPTVIARRRLGTSVRGRAIMAYRVGNPRARTKGVILGSMHGNEQAGIALVNALRAGPPVRGIDLWLVPTMNPDGVARTTRGNARGVDLNRNFGHHWGPLTGSYYSGPRPWSEPETRAMRQFLHRIRPTYVASFHQPLVGIGRSAERRPFQRRLSRNLGLPIRAFNCSGVCYGTMTSWYNARHTGTAITVEFGARPARHYLRHRAARGTVRAMGGSFR